MAVRLTRCTSYNTRIGHRRTAVIRHGGKSDLEVFPQAWGDLASTLSGGSKNVRGPLERLSNDVGREVYMDVSGWHLYLKDAKVDSDRGRIPLNLGVATLALRRYLEVNNVEESCQFAVDEINIKLGGGKMQVPLSKLLPSRCFDDLCKSVEQYVDEEF